MARRPEAAVTGDGPAASQPRTHSTGRMRLLPATEEPRGCSVNLRADLVQVHRARLAYTRSAAMSMYWKAPEV